MRVLPLPSAAVRTCQHAAAFIRSLFKKAWGRNGRLRNILHAIDVNPKSAFQIVPCL